MCRKWLPLTTFTPGTWQNPFFRLALITEGTTIKGITINSANANEVTKTFVSITKMGF
jgi:hypothetical protein